MQTLGIHFLLELSGCPIGNLTDREFVENALLDAARKSGATIVTTAFHTFNPHGVSGVIVIAESHLAIHTWPEAGYAAVDVFTCGDRVMPREAVRLCIEAFAPKHHSFVEIKRGILDDRGDSASCFLSIEEAKGGAT